MRAKLTDRADGLVSLTLARLRAGERPPLDWLVAAVDRGALLEPVAGRGSPPGRRRRALARLGLSVSAPPWGWSRVDRGSEGGAS